MIDAIINLANGHSAPSVWDVMRTQFKLNHETSNPAVQKQIRWIQAHPHYIQELSRSEPYIYHILSEIKKRKLPGELALMPMIESTYDPFAYSGAGAAGLWQLMPGTSADLGVKRDWWYDGRRSITRSTDAALDYLSYLTRFFKGQWTLAVAAYDSGEGTVARAIRRSNQSRSGVNFWQLPLPNETRAYVPRLLALAAIVKHPQYYHIKLPYIPYTPYFEEVNVGTQIDLNHAARLAGISYKEIIRLNPGFNRWTTTPYKPHKLLIPTEKVEDFTQNLASTPKEKLVSWDRHQVQRGDSLSSIAKRYFTTAKIIRELNQLDSERLKTGQFLLIPTARNSPIDEAHKTQTAKQPIVTMPYKVIHFVQAGDSLEKLAQKYNVNPSEIRIWNNLHTNLPLEKGQQLVIWRRPTEAQTYTVKSGDSLSRIAKRFSLKTSDLVRLNPELQGHLLHPGQKLVVS